MSLLLDGGLTCEDDQGTEDDNSMIVIRNHIKQHQLEQGCLSTCIETMIKNRRRIGGFVLPGSG